MEKHQLTSCAAVGVGNNKNCGNAPRTLHYNIQKAFAPLKEGYKLCHLHVQCAHRPINIGSKL